MRRSDETATWRTAVVPTRLRGSSYQRAHDACHNAALLWNHTVAALREFWETNEGDPELKELRHMLAAAPDELRRLHSHTKQAIVDDVRDAVATYRKLRDNGHPDARAPWRDKNYRPLEFTAGYGWKVRGGMLVLSLGRDNQPLRVPVPEVTDPTTGREVLPADWGTIQLCWDIQGRRWTLHVAVPTVAPVPGNPDVVAAIDEGIINPVTIATETDDAYEVTVINGRAARAVRHRRNTEVAALAKMRSRCQKGSRRDKRLQRAQKKREATANRAIHNANHQVSRKAADFVAAHDAGRVVAGDVRGIEQGTRKAEQRRAGRHQRRRLSQWSRGQQESLIEHKTRTPIEHVREDYSSRTCPACLTRNRPSGRNYRCRACSFECHRDAVGALNILQRARVGHYARIDTGKPVRVTYLRATPLRARTRGIAQNRATAPSGAALLSDSAPQPLATPLVDLQVCGGAA